MFVKMDAAYRHTMLVDRFGLPSRPDRCDIEIFGSYHMDDELWFWEFNPRAKVWDVHVCEEYDQRDIKESYNSRGFWTNEEDSIIQGKIRHLALLPRPSMPKNPNNCRRRPQFVFEGWIFGWSFSKTESRWKIMPEGRA